MGIADDIKALGEDIVASYDGRIKAIGVLVKDTHNMLKGFHIEHEEMSDKLKADLAKGEKDRLGDFKVMMASIGKFVSDITKEVVNMIKRFQKEHKEMADALAESLKSGEVDRLKAFKPMMAAIRKEIKEIETYVAKKLKEFDEAHAQMSEELKKMLAKYVDDMVKATKKLMSDIQARQKERNTEVADLLEAYMTEREKMAANWEALVVTMAKKREGKPVISAGTEVKTVEEAVKKPKKKGKKGKKGKKKGKKAKK